MARNRFVSLFALFLAALFLGLPRESWAREPAEAANAENSERSLNRLIEISGQLSILNERLRTELQDSRRNSGQLQTELETSKKELDGLKRELELLRNVSTELSNKAENSLGESAGLRTALKKAESSLTSLELSFAAYRDRAERRISVLERQKGAWKWGCVAAGIVAAGFGGALLAAR